MKRTTILAEEELLLDTKYLAKQLGKSFTDVVREALTEYLAAHRPQERILSIEGIGWGGGPDHEDERGLAERLDDILRNQVDPGEGWSPRRATDRAQTHRASSPDR